MAEAKKGSEGDYEKAKMAMDQYKFLCQKENLLENPMAIRVLNTMDGIIYIKKA